MLLKRIEARILAPIAVVMLPEALAFAAKGCLAAFERIAGSPLLNTQTVSLLKKIELCFVNNLFLKNVTNPSINYSNTNYGEKDHVFINT